MCDNNTSLTSDDSLLDFALSHMYDPIVENRLKLANFVGQVGKERFNNNIILVLDTVLNDESKIVTAAGINSCIDVLNFILKNPTNYEDPSSCVSELKSTLMRALNHIQKKKLRLKILTCFKDFAKIEVEGLESTDLQEQLDDMINDIIKVLESSSKPTDKINCLGFLIFDLMPMDKYKDKIVCILKKLLDQISSEPYNPKSMDLKIYMKLVISHFLSGPLAPKVARELKKIKSPMYSVVVTLFPNLKNPLKKMTEVYKKEFEMQTSCLNTTEDYMRAAEFCCKINHFSLLFHCKPEKLEPLFKRSPGLRSRVIRFTTEEIMSHKSELRKCAILKNLAVKLKN